jgi:RNA polymerase sigma factor (sigma-70 family)
VTEPDKRERFTFDLQRIAPDWPDPAEREAEWTALLGHYYPRVLDYFSKMTRNHDLADDVVSHVIRRALLKLHELGSSHAAWQWMIRTGNNHLTDLRRRQRTEASRLTEASAERRAHAEDIVPADVVTRVAESAGNDPDSNPLGGRVPIFRAQWEERLAQLAPPDRRLLEMIEVEGLSHAEAAAALHLSSPGASRKRHSRACHFLRTGARAP